MPNKSFFKAISIYTVYERVNLHLEVEGKVYIILHTSQEILHMFSSSRKPAAFYTESH